MTTKTFTVEAGHIHLFSQAIGDTNPVHRTREHAEAAGFDNVLAPPTFAQASAHFDETYPGRPVHGEPWIGSGATPSGTPPVIASGGTEMHAEQHFEYHQPMTAGQTLSIETTAGKSWEKQSRRAGTLRFSERIHTYRDSDGEKVLTIREVGVRTEQAVQSDEAER